jgi:hypothetical protein
MEGSMQAQVRDSDRLVVQHGSSLGERDGHTILDLGDEDYAELMAALAQPNSGVRLAEGGALTVLPEPPAPEPPPNKWSEFWSYVQFSEGPDDVIGLLEMVAFLNGGEPPEE